MVGKSLWLQKIIALDLHMNAHLLLRGAAAAATSWLRPQEPHTSHCHDHGTVTPQPPIWITRSRETDILQPRLAALPASCWPLSVRILHHDMAVEQNPDHVTAISRGSSALITLENLLQPLQSPVAEGLLRQLSTDFCSRYKHLAKESREHFLATPAVLPSGQESGTVLAIDVGGTNLRVGFIELLGDNATSIKDASTSAESPKIRRHHEKAWPIEDHLKMDKAEDLFGWIGDCIAEVITAAIDSDMQFAPGATSMPDELPLGVTFSFPMT